MAHFKTLPDDVLTQLERKVGFSLSRITESLGAVSPALHESVDLWNLPANAVSDVLFVNVPHNPNRVGACFLGGWRF
jgi:hypothetical protein